MSENNHTDSHQDSSGRNDWSDWIDAQDVMQKLHISLRTLQTWRTNGILPYSRIRGKLYYRKSDILSLLNENYNGRKGEPV
jgi:hypothetical protein